MTAILTFSTLAFAKYTIFKFWISPNETEILLFNFQKHRKQKWKFVKYIEIEWNRSNVSWRFVNFHEIFLMT